MRATGFGRVVMAALMGMLIGLGIAFTAPASSADPRGGEKIAGDAAIVAAITLLQTVMAQLIQEMFMDQLLGKGQSAIVEQVAANTLGVQAALNHHARTVVDAQQRALTKTESGILQRTFGNLSTMRVRLPDGSERTMNVGATAASACRRVSDAAALAGANTVLRATTDDVRRNIERHNDGYMTASGVFAAMRQSVELHGDDAFRMDFLDRPSIPRSEVDRYAGAIAFAFNPQPLPHPPESAVAGGNLAVREYEVKARQLRELAEIPQRVSARQLVARTKATQDGRSYLETVQSWAQRGVEDAMSPTELAGLTEAGLLREIQLTLSALLWVETENMQSAHEQNQLLAVLASDALNERSVALRQEYARAVTAD